MWRRRSLFFVLKSPLPPPGIRREEGESSIVIKSPRAQSQWHTPRLASAARQGAFYTKAFLISARGDVQYSSTRRDRKFNIGGGRSLVSS